MREKFASKLRIMTQMTSSVLTEERLPTIAIVGNPNVGKSVLFNRLTGKYVTVSNYPGTTVEIATGKAKIFNSKCIILDTPGMYSMNPITEEERVARRLLMFEKPDVVLHVVDAKNISRMLPLTLQLIEAGVNLILVVNMIDEAERVGVKIDVNELREKLGIPVVATACLFGRGVDLLRDLVYERLAVR